MFAAYNEKYIYCSSFHMQALTGGLNYMTHSRACVSVCVCVSLRERVCVCVWIWYAAFDAMLTYMHVVITCVRLDDTYSLMQACVCVCVLPLDSTVFLYRIARTHKKNIYRLRPTRLQLACMS